jgi:hypothetical protein
MEHIKAFGMVALLFIAMGFAVAWASKRRR